MKSSTHAPHFLGHTRATMETTVGSLKKKLIFKSFLNLDCGLQFIHIKLESQVIAGQPYCSEYVPISIHTARHASGIGCT